jgi:lipopolysaccharide/colanic/teichoic acid biosynthesis glycosyltransferase
MKRIFDVAAALIGLLLLWPFFLMIAVFIKLNSPGPIFYLAERIGLGGDSFQAIKFRSMWVGADVLGPRLTSRDDVRITSFGRFLRRYKLDELPQLINVVRGEMSLVGPRPEDPAFVAHYTPQQRRLLEVRPGLTSPASLHFRDEARILDEQESEAVYVQDILPKKLDMELTYLAERSIWHNLGIIWRTIKCLLW